MTHTIRRPLTARERDALSPFSDVLAHLLFHRGFSDAASASDFLSPDYDKDTHDPFLLKDAEKAADRIIRAIDNGEKIAIYADYDADGIPGAVLFADMLKRIGFANFVVYIPHRHDEGFGLNVAAVETLAGDGVKLLITIDCGITDVPAVARAKELGIDVIITDHHEPPAVLPDAYAVIDHRQADCPYPDKNLCGSGVAYKLVQAILKKRRFGIKDGLEKWLLDLVGIATLSDMVPLVGENRVFAHYGLRVLRKTPRQGLRQLMRKLGLSQAHLSEDDIAFMITPRLNAASRMGVPMDAFKLLAADNDIDASFYADHLDEINNERKGVVAALVKEVKRTVRERHGAAVPSVIVLGNPVWRPSLLGLAANSCAEEFDRPVFLWGRDGDNLIKGSCRSEGSSNVVEIMRAVPSGTFSQFGGHRHSGGFAVANESVHHLAERLNEAAESLRKMAATSGGGENAAEAEYFDMELNLDDVKAELYDEVSRLSPFGVGNPKPVFLFRDVIPASVRIFGKARDHVEIAFKRGSGPRLSAIAFFGAASQWAKGLRAGMPIDLAASLEKSMYRNKSELRLRIADVRIR